MRARAPRPRRSLYERLLWLLPFEFRRDYGAEMTEVFDAQRGDARREGAKASMRLWVSTIAGFLKLAPSEHAALIRHDLSTAWRGLRASPAFTIGAIAALALGIGANVAVFNLLQAVILNPLPVREPARLVSIQVTDRQNPGLTPLSTDNFRDFRDQQTSFSGVAGYSFTPVTTEVGGSPQELFAAAVTGPYFEVLGVPAHIGGVIGAEHDQKPGASPVTVLSHRLWTEAFGGDPAVIGRTMRLNGQPFTIIGVAPRGFNGTQTTFATDLYVPLSMYDTVSPGTPFYNGRRWRWLFVLARLKDGVPVQEGAAAAAVIGDRLEKAHPEFNRGRSLTAIPAAHVTINANQHASIAQSGLLLYGVVAIVLLLTCVNLASLLLARSAGRAREIAVRTALGANRWRIVRQLLTESLMLGVAGGVAGLGVAFLIQRALWASRPANFLRARPDLSFDLGLLLFTLALSIAAGLLFGLLPALQSSRTDLVTALKMAGRQPSAPGRRRLRDLLVASEIALSIVALVAAGVLVRSLQRAEQIDPGFDAAHLTRFNYSLRGAGYSLAEAHAFHARALEAIRAVPGVRHAAIVDRSPLSPGGALTITIAGQTPPPGALGFLVQHAWVSPGYFDTLGVPLIAGRLIEDTDVSGKPLVAVINETMARRFWPGGDPIGQRFTSPGLGAPVEVVGIVRDQKYVTLGEAPQPFMHLALRQVTNRSGGPLTLLVASVDADGAITAGVRDAMRALNSSIPLTNIATGRSLVSAALWGARTSAGLVGALGMLALILAMIGIYSVTAYSVTQSRQEIGLRLTLGATPRGVLTSVVWRGMRLAAAGAAAGVVAAFAAADVLTALLYGVDSRDPVTFVTVPALFILIAAAACLLPAVRAARTDPAQTLRG